MKRFFLKYRYWFAGFVFLVLAVFYFSLPEPLFKSPYSTVVYSQEGDLLGARIATDGQWRFPAQPELPEMYVKAVLTFEDKRFYNHLGIDPLAIGRALVTNMKAGHIVQGGSTLTMQVARMARGNQPRTILQKCIEMWIALRVECAFSKREILQLYAAHAPFGGNVVGLEAASWRYFHRPPSQLSLAECALLAVLPNAPSAMRPGKENEALLQKRNALLDLLHQTGQIDESQFTLALLEDIPNRPAELPNLVPHVTDRARLNYGSQIVQSTIKTGVQNQTKQIVSRHHRRFAANGVHNAGVLVAEVQTGKIVAYVGNTTCGMKHGQYVDVCTAPRSSGSILKPFLFQAMQQNGQLLPNQLVADIPTFYAGFAPENYSRDFHGAVHASDALARSLNVPAVRELKAFGVPRFLEELHRFGFSTVNRSADNYGLSLILGGAEVTLWDVCAGYLSLAQSAKGNRIEDGALHVLQPAVPDNRKRAGYPGAAYLTLQALRQANRGSGWQGVHDYVNPNIAWKTGTSFGFRDAWAVGVSANYVVAVWVGNADGEGRPGVIGAEVAAPLMFEVFSALPQGDEWFQPPYNQLQQTAVCGQSGFLASALCDHVDTTWTTFGAENAELCTFHHTVLVNAEKTLRYDADCAPTEQVAISNWFVLPPAWELYYLSDNPDYAELPPMAKTCGGNDSRNPMQIIYPNRFQKVYPAKQLSGDKGPVVLKLAHRNQSKAVYWHLNGAYYGQTKEIHDLPVELEAGKYTLFLVDEDGFELNQSFEVL